MDTTLLLYIAAAFVLGLLIGFIASKMTKTTSTKSSSLEKGKLENEVLKDKVTQLTAKIQTLEKALELSQE